MKHAEAKVLALATFILVMLFLAMCAVAYGWTVGG